MSNEILAKVESMEGVAVEKCGTFLWLSGNTYEHRREIKALGFKWSAGKQKWFLAPKGWHGKRGKGWSMDRIRAEHGSEMVFGDKALVYSA